MGVTQLAADNKLIFTDISRLNDDVFTYCSDSGLNTSWTDHILCSTMVDNTVSSVNILYDFISSDHKPIEVSFDQLLCVQMSNQIKVATALYRLLLIGTVLIKSSYINMSICFLVLYVMSIFQLSYSQSKPVLVLNLVPHFAESLMIIIMQSFSAYIMQLMHLFLPGSIKMVFITPLVGMMLLPISMSLLEMPF